MNKKRRNGIFLLLVVVVVVILASKKGHSAELPPQPHSAPAPVSWQNDPAYWAA